MILMDKVKHFRKENIIQFIKFGIVGVSNTLLSYVIYLLSIFVLGELNILQNVDYYIGNVLSFVISVLWSCFLEKKK